MPMTLQSGGDRRRCLGAGLFRKDPTTGSRLYFDPDHERVEERAPV